MDLKVSATFILQEHFYFVWVDEVDVVHVSCTVF